jgi:beta-glucosidase/6-phospho-beta-glucosidase/beta-galactosidase
MKITEPNLSSFFIAGFECTYAKAEEGKRFDLLKASRHDEMIREDYEMIAKHGITTVREGLSWSQIDEGKGVYDFSRFEPMMKVGKELGIQQLWDLNHFDFPDHLDPFSDAFVKAFGEYAKHVIELIRKYQKGTLYITPFNEISFFAWMSDRGLWAPYAKGQGDEYKKRLVKAALHAMDSIWEVDKDVQFLHIDPFMYRQPLRVRSKEEQDFCNNFNEHVRFHAWDMICGKAFPELGGDPKYLNIVGINYYFYNQQLVGLQKEVDKDEYIFRSLSLNHPKRVPLHEIISIVYERYKKPIIITETGSYRNRRPTWWEYILKEVDTTLEKGVPLYGVCSYPTLDILSGAGFIIPKSGLWDFDQKVKDYKRMPEQDSLQIIQKYIRKWQKN